MEHDETALTPEPEKRGRKKREVIYQEPPPILDTSAAPSLPPLPEPTRKIALLGSAVSSVALAPFNDPEWEIWACSPANQFIPRWDVWFELHNLDVKRREGLTEYLERLQKQPKPIFLQKALPDWPTSREYPLKEAIAEFGPFWWTSQLSYMIAAALMQEPKPKAIALYGVDMAANSEYNQQRLACQYFMQIALKRDILLVVPPESDILEPAPLYGFCESSRQWRKYYARKIELTNRVNDLKGKISNLTGECTHLSGALDDMDYHMAHWANRRDFY